jgi:hypothetical protein
MMLYFIPAFLYCLYNNLAFVSLSAFDPTTYYLLLQFRVVVTGIVFQVSVVLFAGKPCHQPAYSVNIKWFLFLRAASCCVYRY